MVDCSVFNISVSDLMRYLRYKKTPIFCSDQVGILARKIRETNSQSTEIGRAFAQWFNYNHGRFCGFRPSADGPLTLANAGGSSAHG